MRLYIRNAKRAVKMLFRRGNDEDYTRCEKIEVHNKTIAEQVYNRVINGDYAYQRANNRMIAFTRSTRGNFIQYTHFARIRGEMTATSHSDITSAKELYDRLFTGAYITIREI